MFNKKLDYKVKFIKHNNKTIGLVFAFLLLCLINADLVQAQSSNFRTNPNYKLQLDLYDIYKLKQADVVMLGNSLTHGANWNELLGRPNVVERGIVSDVLAGFAARLYYVTKLKPKIVFILGGLNDIYNWIPVETIYQDYIKIIEELKRNKITPVIQSTLYAGRDWGKDWLEANRPELDVPKYNGERNTQVDKLNEMLSNFAKVNQIEFIDINSKLSRGGYLKPEVTYDGAHLNANGYKIWAEEVDKILRKNGM